MAQRKPMKRASARRRGPLRSPTGKPPRPGARDMRDAPRAHVDEAQSAGPSQKLHKVLAQSGLGSRRTMEEWIREGKVTVNGSVASIGARVNPSDLIRIGRKVIRWPSTQRLPRV